MKVLVVDDEQDILIIVQGIFEWDLKEVDLITASDGQEALARFKEESPDLVVTDLLMPRLDGEALLHALHKESPSTPVIIMSAHGTVDKAVGLLRAGARDFITKPFSQDDFVHRLRLAMENIKLQNELNHVKEALEEQRKESRILHASQAMKDLISRVSLAAKSSAPVLITGESGTGKELMARELHLSGPRRARPFVAINCGAFPETLLESELFGYKKGAFTGAARDNPGVIMEANHGTLFLDEIGETPLTFQVKLLRFLQEGEIRAIGDGRPTTVDVRVVAATNQDLRRLITEGRFREDLFYRLHVIPLHIPPLRERPEDVLLLANHFLRKYSTPGGRVMTLSPAAAQKIAAYRWPGNVRQLENAIYQLCVMSPSNPIQPQHVDLELETPARAAAAAPPAPQLTLPFKDAKARVVDSFERTYLEALLGASLGSPSRASERSGLDRKNLWRLLKKHGLELSRFRPDGQA